MLIQETIREIGEALSMIDYTPFWETLENSKENWYTLTEKHGID